MDKELEFLEELCEKSINNESISNTEYWSFRQIIRGFSIEELEKNNCMISIIERKYKSQR